MNGHSSNRNRIRLGVLAAATIIIMATIHYIGLTNRSKVLSVKLDQTSMEMSSLSIKNTDLEKQNKILEKRLAEKDNFHESNIKLKESQIQELKDKNSKLERNKAELTAQVEKLKHSNEKLEVAIVKKTEERDRYKNKTRFLNSQLSDVKVYSYSCLLLYYIYYFQPLLCL